MYRPTDEIRLVFRIFWMDEIEVVVPRDSNGSPRNDNAPDRNIDQSAARAKSVQKARVNIKFIRAATQKSIVPYNRQITINALPDFTDEKIHVRISHSNADNGNRSALVPSGHSSETAFGFEMKGLGRAIQVGSNCARTRRRANSNLSGYSSQCVLYAGESFGPQCGWQPRPT